MNSISAMLVIGFDRLSYHPAPLCTCQPTLCCADKASYAHLSPRPCATMTVEVCRFSAGTTKAAALDIVPFGLGSLCLLMF